MGAVRSSNKPSSECNGVCSCFTNDQRIKSKDFIRCTSSKWIWSKEHDSTLTASFSNESNAFPIDIIRMIKDYSYSDIHDHHIQQYEISHEKLYTESKYLLSKPLCNTWITSLSSHCSVFEPLSIALVGKHSERKKQLFERFMDNEYLLPSLHLQNTPFHENAPNTITRTVLIDGCAVAFRIWNVDENEVKLIPNAQIYLMHLDEKDDVRYLDRTMKKLCAKKDNINGVVIKSANHDVESQQLCTKYNMPYIETGRTSDISIHKMVLFAVKYYWFRSMHAR